MKITQDVRDYAAGLGEREKAALDHAKASGLTPEQIRKAMAEKAEEFRAKGAQLYVEEG